MEFSAASGGFDMTLVHEMQHAFGARPAFEAIQSTPVEGRIVIGCEQPGDAARREALLDAAFGRKERFAKTCQRLRDGRLPTHGLSLAARKNGEYVGTLRMWHVDAGGVPALLLGPLAVARTQRAQGIGGLLMNEALARAAEFGHRAVILVGDAPYYAPFGFTRAHTRTLAMPGPIDEARFLGLELQEGALEKAQGIVAPTGALDLRAHRQRALRAVSRAA
jgi:predicted N-acetyltransferase YhbS